MLEQRLHSITTRLDRVFNLADSIQEEEIKSHLARYLCILTSGYFEESIKIIIEYYASKNATPNIVNYVSQTTRKLTNLNTEKIENFLSSFNPKLKDDFNYLLTDEGKDALDSVIANRNNIAHGKNVGVSYIRIRNWYNNIKKIIVNIRSILSVLDH